MSSCVFDYLNTAFGRYAELGICQSHTYESRNGPVIYISCPTTNKPVLEEYLNTLSFMSSTNQRGQAIIEGQIAKVIL